MKEFDYDAREYIGLFHTSGCVKSAPEPRRLCLRKQSSVELKRNKSNSASQTTFVYVKVILRDGGCYANICKILRRLYDKACTKESCTHPDA